MTDDKAKTYFASHMVQACKGVLLFVGTFAGAFVAHKLGLMEFLQKLLL